jgi:hypothetical protein
VTDVSRVLRGALPFVAALSAVIAFALPANAAPPGLVAQPTPVAQPGPVAQPTRAAQWWLTALNVPRAWRAVPGEGKGITVAVLSTGVAAAHGDLAGAVATGPDYSASGRTAGGPFWGFEGTAVASLIAGHGDGPGGAAGITGIAPRARVLSVRVTLEYNDPLNSDVAVTRRLPAAIAAGIRYAVARGASIIALPLDPGTLGPAASGDPAAAGGSAAERTAVSYALGRGVVLVAPAGDNGAGTGTVNYPAAYPGVIAVGATVRNSGLAPYTSTRSYVALTAPGSGLTTAAPGGGYDSLASTDMSSALTAGVAALIRARFPRLTPAEVAQALGRGTAAKPGAVTAPGTGHGALDAVGAVTAAAAIAAAHPVPSPHASSAGAAPPATHRVTHRLTAQPSGFGGVAGAVLRDAVLAACALIAVLAAALAVSAARRRRALAAARSSQLQRTGQGGSHARRPGTALAALPAGSRDQALPRGPRGGTRGGNGTRDSAGPRIVPMSAVLMPRTGRTRGRHKATGEPPWEPASRPPTPMPAVSRTALPGARAALPAGGGQPWTGPDEQVPPWELAPAEFAAAPLTTDFPDWSPSSSGPMYVWNPATSGPLPAIPRDPADEDQARDLSERAGGASLTSPVSGGELGLHVGRVLVHVVLAGQLPDRLHHLVGDGPPRPGRRLARQVAELARLADPDLDPRRPRQRRARGQHLPGAHHRDREHRRAGVQRQIADPRPAAVEPAVRRPGPLRVEPEQLTRPQDLNRRLQRGLRGSRPLPVHLKLVGRPQIGGPEPAERALGREVLGLRREYHRPVDHQRQVNRVDERQVVGREDRGSLRRDVLLAHHPRSSDRAQERANDGPRKLILHSGVLCLTSGPGLRRKTRRRRFQNSVPR